MSARYSIALPRALFVLALPCLALVGCVTAGKNSKPETAALQPGEDEKTVAATDAAPGAKTANGSYVDPTVNAKGTNLMAGGAQPPLQGAGAAAPAPADIGGLVMQPTNINAQAMSIFSSRQAVPQNNQSSTLLAPSAASGYVAPAGGIAPVRSSVFSQPQPALVAPPSPGQQSSATDPLTAPAVADQPAFRTTSQAYSAPARNLFGGLTTLLEKASLPAMTRVAPNGVHVQNDAVQVSCFKPKLVGMIRTLEDHFGKPVIVSSGYRDPEHNRLVGGADESLHKSCDAADIQIDGVSKLDVAAFVRALPERGGVGTYCHTQSVHIDTGTARDWNWGCGKSPGAGQAI